MPETASIATLRTMILGILVFGLVGTGVELLLLGHTEGYRQWAPLALLGLGLCVVAWCAVSRRRARWRALQMMMGLLIVSGVAGTWWHYSGNAEFEREMAPSIAGLALFWASMTGATPALAPGTMTLLGLIGLVYGYGQER